MAKLETCIVCGNPVDDYSISYTEGKACEVYVWCQHCGSEFTIKAYTDPRDADAVTKWNNLARTVNADAS